MTHMKTAARRLAAALILTALLAMQAFAAVPAYLIPGGNTVGIKLYTQGLMIVKIADGTAAQAAGLRAGDTIVAVNGEAVGTAKGLCARVQEGNRLILTVRRGTQEAEFLVAPEKAPSGYRLGISLRDHVAGIGTVTYYDPDTKQFGALGHGVSGTGGTELTPVTSGFVVSSRVSDVQKGSRGTPGMLKGVFDLSHAVGTVTENSARGIFGVMQTLPHKAAVPVAGPGAVHTGPAKILSNVKGAEICEYDVEIVRLMPEAQNGRDLLLRVTDPALLEATGGIVQGMSGSPILQDGRLVGAVTHVLVSDPTRGYGILIENMLDAAG